jgi:hypothetical protein
VLRRLIADNYPITALPVDMPGISNAIVTLKSRTLSPVVERFLASVREVAASWTISDAEGRGGRSPRSLKVIRDESSGHGNLPVLPSKQKHKGSTDTSAPGHFRTDAVQRRQPG